MITDTTVAQAGNGSLVHTSGAGQGTLQVSPVRASMFGALTGIDHGYGQVRLDGCHITNITNTFVNNGSGNNWLSNFTNTTPGFTYITAPQPFRPSRKKRAVIMSVP